MPYRHQPHPRWSHAGLHFRVLLLLTLFAIPRAIAQDTRPADSPSATETQPASQPAEPKPLTLEAIYGPENAADFEGSHERGMSWLDDGRHFLDRRDGQLMRVDALTEEAIPAYEQAALEAALLAHEDFDEKQAARFARRPSYRIDDLSTVLINHGGSLYVYRFAENRLRKLTRDTGSRRLIDLSPGGDAVSFVRDNDLYVIDARTGRQRRITRDGSETLLNGVLDWVYQEEIYGRGRWRASWWRDDAEYLAYLQLDDSQVPIFTLIDFTPHRSETEQIRYPKAGDPNPTVRLGVARLKNGRTTWVDLSKYDGTEILIVRVGWAPDGQLLFSVQDREQRWLELNEADPRTGRMRTLIRETSPAWTVRLPLPHWLDDDTFLWQSDRDGYRHIYHCARDGRLIRRVTAGTWAIDSIVGYDERTGWIYFTGSRETVFENHAYRVPLEGGNIQRITEPGYSHRVSFDPTLRLFFDTFSNVATPTKVHLRRQNGQLVRVVSENRVAALEEYVWSPPELLRIPNRDGLMMNARLLRPPDFDPSQKYPVWCSCYGAPEAQSVRNTWGGTRGMFDQFLAQQGYIVWHFDPHQSSGEGAVSAWHAYRKLGQTELADIEDGLNWLIAQGGVDPDRIGFTGYSYGGYTTAYALTHSKMFKLGIAGALLSDWRNYDSVYIERYMQTPEHNPEGYEKASVSNAAENLHGLLVLVHGLRDDNVHFQNTAQLIDALQQANKMFHLMVYPRDRHGIGRGHTHFREMTHKYIFEEL